MLFLDDHRKTIGRLNDWVKDWTKREGIRPSQIAILFPLRKDNSVLADQRDLGGTDLTENLEDWQADRGVLFSTIRSFKGLESDIVVLVDVIEPDVMSTFLRSDLYVGCSRAKHVLKILSQVPESRLFERHGREE